MGLFLCYDEEKHLVEDECSIYVQGIRIDNVDLGWRHGCLPTLSGSKFMRSLKSSFYVHLIYYPGFSFIAD